MVKNLPATWETQVWSLGWEDPLEKSMVTHSSILAWRIPRTEEPGRLQSMGVQRVRHNWTTFTFIISPNWCFHYSIWFTNPNSLPTFQNATECIQGKRKKYYTLVHFVSKTELPISEEVYDLHFQTCWGNFPIMNLSSYQRPVTIQKAEHLSCNLRDPFLIST